MLKLTSQEYYAKHRDFRGVWESERHDIPDWKQVRLKYVGKRTMLMPGPVLAIEGLHFEIIEMGIK